MLVTLVRTVILYVLVIFAVRLMGKRQIGELQPTELVVTILLSEIAAIPMQNNEIPLLSSVISVALLISLEIISSVIAMKSGKFRTVIEGNAVFIIREGKLQQKEIKKLRYSIDDIMEALREKGVFDISEVEYAVVETNGTLSIALKVDEQPVTAKMLDLPIKEKGVPSVVVSDGRYIDSNFIICKTTKKEIDKILSEDNLKAENVLMMTLDKAGNKFIVMKDDQK